MTRIQDINGTGVDLRGRKVKRITGGNIIIIIKIIKYYDKSLLVSCKTLQKFL